MTKYFKNMKVFDFLIHCLSIYRKILEQPKQNNLKFGLFFFNFSFSFVKKIVLYEQLSKYRQENCSNLQIL